MCSLLLLGRIAVLRT